MPIERTTVETADGVALEAESHVVADAWAAVVLAHPHPQYGGSMYAPLIELLFEALPAEGVVALRFNFRGVGASTGSHGGGIDDQRDVEACIGTVADAFPGLPILAAGWSFGADVSLCVDDERITGWFAMAPPLRTVPIEAMVAAADPRPKLLVVPEHDQFRPPDAARDATQAWTATQVEVVPGVDHFFAGGAARARDLCLGFLSELTKARP